MSLRVTSFLAMVIITLATLLVMAFNRVTRLTAEKKQAIEFANNAHKDLVFYKNSHGEVTARSQALELSLKNAQSLSESDRLSFVKEFDGVKRNLRNLKHAVRITGELAARYSIPLQDSLVYLDGDSVETSVQKFSYRDSLNAVSGVILSDTAIIRIEATVPIRAAAFWTRKWFLGKKRYHFDVTSTNPNVKIIESESITIRKR